MHIECIASSVVTSDKRLASISITACFYSFQRTMKTIKSTTESRPQRHQINLIYAHLHPDGHCSFAVDKFMIKESYYYYYYCRRCKSRTHAFSYRTLPDSVNQNLSSAIDVILRVVYLLHPRKGEKYCEFVMIVSVCPFIRMS